MYEKMKKCLAILLSIAMLSSVFSGMTVPDYTEVIAAQTVESEQSVKNTATAVTVNNSIGSISLEQTKINETGLTLKIAEVNKILAESRADRVRITAKMYYQDTVTQSVIETISLNKDQTEYDIDMENFGKFKVFLEYLQGGNVVEKTETVTVGIAASAYNLAPISATFPAVLFSLSLWEGSDYNITRDADGNPIPTFAVFERADSWDWDNLPDNVYKLPTASASEFTGVKWGGQAWIDSRNKMAAYIKDLYEISPDATFNLYYTDNFVENMLWLLVANQIPESQYHTILLSDGSGTYAYFNNTFRTDDGTLYDDMRADWEALKHKTREEGKFDPAWAKYASSKNLGMTCLPKYAAVAAEDENVDWWVARTNGTFAIENKDLLTKVVSNCTVKGVSGMLASVQASGNDKAFQQLYHFDADMFDSAGETGKPVMLILGSTVGNEPDFKDYVGLIKKHYGYSYEYYYKGHPGTPTALYPSKQQDLEELGVTDVDSSIPAELILFFFPDIYMCGYDSTTFQSVESDQMACGMFNKSKSEILASKTYGEMLDFFARRIDRSNGAFSAYLSLCTETDHVYYLLEYNDTKDADIAIYDANDQVITYYKNIGSADEVQWSGDVMKNLGISEIASYDYTGKRIKPEITVTQGDKVLTKGVDYTLSYGNNVLPGQGTVIIKGKADYANFGSVTQYFTINKIDNPLKVSCDNVSYGTKIQPEVLNPSLGDLTYAYKGKGEETYSDVVPTEPGEYTLRVTSDYTACYKAATAEVDFMITRKDPVVTWPAAGAIRAGQSLADSALTGGEADVDGDFVWKDGTIKPSVEDSQRTEYSVVFTPADQAHYNVMQLELTITVQEDLLPTNTPEATATPDAQATATPDAQATTTPDAQATATPDAQATATPDAQATATPDVQATATPSVQNGQKITVNKMKYVVNITKKAASVTFTGCTNKKVKKVSVPNSITYQGTVYPVTQISAKAFKGNSYLTRVTIGSSVTTIGKAAFYNCKNLKNITIKSKKIKIIGINAFKGIHKKAKFKLPDSKKKKYENKITKSGFKL